MKTSYGKGALAFVLITVLHASAVPAVAQELTTAKPRLPRLTGIALLPEARATMPAPMRWEASEQAQDGQGGGQTAPATRPVRKKNKALVYGGLALIGGGVAMMAWGSTSTSQHALTQTYNVKIAGAVFAGVGGLFLGLGIRGK